MKKFLISFLFMISMTGVSFADQWVGIPQFTQSSPHIIMVEPPVMIAPRPLVKTIEWILTPQVNNVIVQEVRMGLFGRRYIVNKNELVTTWVYVPVEVWK